MPLLSDPTKSHTPTLFSKAIWTIYYLTKKKKKNCHYFKSPNSITPSPCNCSVSPPLPSSLTSFFLFPLLPTTFLHYSEIFSTPCPSGLAPCFAQFWCPFPRQSYSCEIASSPCTSMPFLCSLMALFTCML